MAVGRTRVGPWFLPGPGAPRAGRTLRSPDSGDDRSLSQRGSWVTMSIHSPISSAEAADRLAIRELVDAYAHCADRRDAEGQMALFTEDTHFVVYMDARDPRPAQDLSGRAALAPVF